jgi:hypothetical protein
LIEEESLSDDAYKKDIEHYIIFKILTHNLYNGLLFQIVLPKNGDILYGVVYVPPKNSIFASDDLFLEIQTEMDTITIKI